MGEQSERPHPDRQREDVVCIWDAVEALRGSGLRILDSMVC